MRRVAVKSASVGGTLYVVEGDAGGTLRCSCPRYEFSPAERKTCKHVAWVRMADLLSARCREAHALPGGAVCFTCLVEIVGRALQREEPKRRTRRAARYGIMSPHATGGGHPPPVSCSSPVAKRRG